MSRLSIRGSLFASAVAAVAVAAMCFPPVGRTDGPAGKRRAPSALVAFGGERELRAYARRIMREREKGSLMRAAKSALGSGMSALSDSSAPASPAAESSASNGPAKDDGESITNNQVSGVDEGGIVKTHGKHLVVLRRGRLFTIELGDQRMIPVSSIDVPQKATGNSAWYDEMLVDGDTIVVIGYSYEREGTEINLFRIDAAGKLARNRSFYLRSNDYYSSRNYASRLVNGRLVFYMPLQLVGYGRGADGDVNLTLPAMRTGDDWHRIIRASEIYRPIQDVGTDPVLHTVVSCDLRGDVQCRARGVIGTWGRSFFVSRSAVYVWTEGAGSNQYVDGEDGGSVSLARANAAVYRMPFGLGNVGAVRASGSPIDQFSFEESNDGTLYVVVRSNGAGDAMWNAEATGGSLALAKIPLAAFQQEVTAIAARRYARLPSFTDWNLQNRFVGDYVLIGAGNSWGTPEANKHERLVLHAYRTGRTARIDLAHGVDRIEAMGQYAVAIGSNGSDLHFTSVTLDQEPRIVGSHVSHGASQGETRSHGFFYKPTDGQNGVLGLPVRGGSEPGWYQLRTDSAGVAFLRMHRGELTPFGFLEAGASGETDDKCVASCVDWYGNARPIFYGGRVMALLGYELVEGEPRMDGRLHEVARLNFVPGHVRQSSVLDTSDKLEVVEPLSSVTTSTVF